MLRNVERLRLALPDRGVEIALLDFGGDGPPLLAHHANGFCAGLWAPVAERLRERFHVVAMDARGHGDSSHPSEPGAFEWHHFAEDLAAVAAHLVEQAGRPLAVGLGHSFGGTSTMAAAALRPDLFERIVCVDPVVFPPEVPDAARLAHGKSLVDRASKRRREWPDRAAALEHFRPRSLFAGWPDRSLALYVDEGMRRRPDGSLELKCAPEVEAAVFASGRGFGLFERAAGLATPALLLWARHGNFPRPLYTRLVAEMAAARVEDVDAGHLVPMEKPEIVIDAVEAFAAGPQASTA
ncbi:MAG: alpha/beta hydrolase [Deltaproteobacteria bacterium]|nr:alpha/beta hydrolase [Deltaproteobacteria bacterium]MBW2446316.1 alpha/beta hydrolase [Deltaproteobacteria bacterium]